MDTSEEFKPLTPKEEHFCQVFVDTRNATQATRDAGYTSSDPASYGYKMVRKRHIREHIRTLDAACKEEILITAYSTIHRLQARASTSIAHFTHSMPDGTLKIDMNKCSEAEKQGIAQYESHTKPDGTVVQKIKLCDREKNEEMIAKRLGMFEEDNKQRLPVVISRDMPARD